jgi:uncharacterized delta-60 repeat protein
MKRITALILLLFTSALAYGQAGYLDKTFGDGGVFLNEEIKRSLIPTDVAILSDGKILECGYTVNDLSDSAGLSIIRLQSNGIIDSSFGSNGRTTILAGYYFYSKLYIASNGDIFAYGYCRSNIGGINRSFLAKFYSNGLVDHAFGLNGIYISPEQDLEEFIFGVRTQNDGTIIALGSRGESNNSFRLYCPTITKFTREGKTDITFGVNGVLEVSSQVDTSYVMDAVFDNEGFCLFGCSMSIPVANETRILRCDINGKVDANFGEKGVASVILSDQQDILRSMKVLKTGKILCLVDVASGLYSRSTFLRFTAGGRIDSSFGDWGIVASHLTSERYYVSKFTIDSSDKIIALGDVFSATNNRTESLTIRFLLNCKTDYDYGNYGYGELLPYNEVSHSSIGIQADGKYVVAGFRSDSNGYNGFIYRLHNTGISRVLNTDLSSSSISLHPTPSTDNCTATYTLPASGECRVTLRDESGREVRTFASEYRTAGEHKEELDLRGLSAGVYFLQIEANGATQTAKLIKQ